MSESQKALMDIAEILRRAGWDLHDDQAAMRSLSHHDNAACVSEAEEKEKREFIDRMRRAAEEAGLIPHSSEPQRALRDIIWLLLEAGWNEPARTQAGK